MAVLQKSVWLLTDFGGDYAVGRLKGSVLKKRPELEGRIHDLDHQVPSQGCLAGAWRLLASIPSVPKDSVIVAVVDPHVGTERKGVAVKLKTGHILVGPADNGLLYIAAKIYGVEEIRFLQNPGLFNGSELVLSPSTTITGDFFTSVDPTIGNGATLKFATFHGLQIFGPVAAHLATGTTFESLGNIGAIESLGVVHLPLSLEKGKIRGCFVDVDAFGTLRTNIPSDLLSRIRARFGDQLKVSIFRYGDCSAGCAADFEDLAAKDVQPQPGFYGGEIGNVRFVRVFSDEREGHEILLPGSCGGTLDLAIVNGSFAARLPEVSKSRFNAPSLLTLENGLSGLTPNNLIEIEPVNTAVRQVYCISGGLG
ncbi:SAM-dependent chlorinase/fluorinase [Candidatus Micrarchaeota archaeon]|nr:SAM-dependent chlorinase/fluorinase [Candidatus Micrarchaeota archaeon]